jgi:hypothetical protein
LNIQSKPKKLSREFLQLIHLLCFGLENYEERKVSLKTFPIPHQIHSYVSKKKKKKKKKKAQQSIISLPSRNYKEKYLCQQKMV